MEEINTNQQQGRGNFLWMVIGVVGVILVLGLLYFYALYNKNKTSNVVDARKVAHLVAYRQSITSTNPKPLQDSFASDVRNGINDQFTKSDAYFVTHRFFDNGGNIYEIYDYINAHKELAFLKEAEAIYPDIFQKIHDGTLPKRQTDSSLYAYLAYVEVLEKHGYTDIAALSTAANQYAKAAYYDSLLAKEVKPKIVPDVVKSIQRNRNKGVEYANKAKGQVADIIDGKITSNDIPERDILVGVNQYGAALRYLSAQGITVDSPKTADQVFAFATGFSRRSVPELQWFTGLLDATTIAISSSSSPTSNDAIRVALKPILDFNVRARAPVYVVGRILNSKSEAGPDANGYMNLEMYSKRNTVFLSKRVAEFRTWLLNSGWTEKDFQVAKPSNQPKLSL